MRFLGLSLGLLMIVGCGESGFEPEFAPDARMNLDLATTNNNPADDLACPNKACGGCSNWEKFDGTPSAAGDACNYAGALMCSGTALICSSAACPSCTGMGAGQMVGSICGADGHTMLQIISTANSCEVKDLGTAIAVCNRDANDHCVHRCVKDGNTYNCAASCVSDDGGGVGCAFSEGATCQDLTGC